MVSREDRLFEELVSKFVKEYLEFNSLTSTRLGLHEYNSLLHYVLISVDVIVVVDCV